MKLKTKIGATLAGIALVLGGSFIAAPAANAGYGWQACNDPYRYSGSIGTIRVVNIWGGIIDLAPGRCVYNVQKAIVFAGQRVVINNTVHQPYKNVSVWLTTNTYMYRTK